MNVADMQIWLNTKIKLQFTLKVGSKETQHSIHYAPES